jgi:hypothetical protein
LELENGITASISQSYYYDQKQLSRILDL